MLLHPFYCFSSPSLVFYTFYCVFSLFTAFLPLLLLNYAFTFTGFLPLLLLFLHLLLVVCTFCSLFYTLTAVVRVYCFFFFFTPLLVELFRILLHPYILLFHTSYMRSTTFLLCFFASTAFYNFTTFRHLLPPLYSVLLLLQFYAFYCIF